MFEDRTFDNLMSEALATIPDKMDKRQGSMVYDMIAPYAKQLSDGFIDLQNIIDLIFISSSKGSYLDDWGWTFGISRNPARSAVYNVVFVGNVRPQPGTRFFDNESGLYFVLVENDEHTLLLEAEATGVETNVVREGTAAIPVNTIRGLEEAAFGDLVEPGTDTESDDDYRERIHEALAGPAENGNRQHYKTWCESISGVGRAKIVPLFAGPNTVMGVLFGTQGEPASGAVVERVQEYVDPRTKGFTVQYEGHDVPVGDGLGNGAANIGAHFAAVAARALPVDVEINVLPATGYTLDAARQDIHETLTKYFLKLALNGSDDKNSVVRINNIGAEIVMLPSVLDYDTLLLNGKASSIIVGTMEAAVLRGVTVTSENISR